MEVLLKVCVSSPEWVCIQPSPHSFQDTSPNPPLQHFLKPHPKAAQSFSSQSSSSSCWSAAPHGDGVGAGERAAGKNELIWRRLILDMTKCGKSREALRIYKQMQEAGVKPSTHTFVAALKACSSLGDLETGKKIHAHVIDCSVEWHIFVANTLVHMYAKCGSMKDAQGVFDRMPYRDVVSWNALILGYAQREQGGLALQLFTRMQCEGFAPNAQTFVGALKACSGLAAKEQGKEIDGEIVKLGFLEKGRSIHFQVRKSGLESDIFVGSILVDMYGKCGSMADAREVFDRMQRRDVVSWNAMIQFYAEREEGEVALQLYERMQHEGFLPDSRTFVGALRACGCLAAQEHAKEVDGKLVKLVSLEKGRGIHSQISKIGLNSNIFVATTLVDMYAKCGSLVDARQVFNTMPHRDVVAWNAMIHGYSENEEGELALQLYERMQHEGFAPDARTFVGALKACDGVAALENGKAIHAHIFRVGLEGDAIVATALLDMYGKCGSMADAQQLFDALLTRDVVAWSALIAGYSRRGDSDRVFGLFQRMHQEGVLPNGITFLSILTACTHVGLLDEGWKYFQAMSADYGIDPNIDHYNCMVDLLGRAGQLDEAVALVSKMPFQPNLSTWSTILGACQKWNDVEIGRWAFESAMRLSVDHAPSYVVMSNIYATAGMCEESCKVQAMRRNAQARKKPG